MAKIFISAFSGNIDKNNPAALPCFIDSFLTELKNSGNHVLFYSSPVFYLKKWSEIPEYIETQIKNFSPDLIILFNNCFYDYDFSKSFDCPVIVLEVDSYLYFSNKHLLKNNKNYYFVVQADDSVKNIQYHFHIDKNHIFRIPVFTSVQSEEVDATTNISFIGTFFPYTDCVRNFMLQKPDADEIEQFKRVCNYVERHPFVDFSELIKAEKIESSKILSDLSVEKYGAFVCSRNRIKTLSAVADLGLSLYGSESWLTAFDFYPEIALSYKSQKVYSLKHNQDVYNQSKIGISIAHIQAQSGFPLRIMDVMASNACLVSDYHSDFEIYFPKVKIPVFDSPEMAKEVCARLLHNETERLDIVAQCQEIIDKNYRFSRYRKNLEEVSGVTLTSETSGDISFISNSVIHQENKKVSYRNKLRYKIWKHLGKKLKKKGII